MKRLLDNFYQIGGESLTHPLDGASYLITDDGKNNILIDCGSPEGYPALKQNLGSIGLKVADISCVFVTHAHRDHASAAQLLGESDAMVYVHAQDEQTLIDGNYDRTASFLYGKEFTPILAERTVAIENGFKVKVGKIALSALFTPGHTPGSMCYEIALPESRVLVAGDTLWGGFHPRIGSDLQLWSQSLETLISREYDFVTFGHGIDYLVSDASSHLAKARRHFGVYLNPWREPNTVQAE